MKGFSVVVLILALAACGWAQQQPVLGDAQPLDVRIDRVDWHPKGDALLYSRAEEGGVGIGLYRLGDVEGKVLLHLNEKDTWESLWLAGLPDAVVTVYRSVATGQGQQKEAALYLLNVKSKAATELFSKIVPANESIHLFVDASPSLLHAIVTVHIGKETAHYVLPNNGGKLVAARDIDEAVKAGNSGPNWSLDGTAIYGGTNGSIVWQSGAAAAVDVVPSKTQERVSKEASITFTVATDKLSSDIASYMSFKLVPPPPPIGASVFEVVPSNGVLRPVRFKGSWATAPAKPKILESKSNPSQLVLGQLRGSSSSLWLMSGKSSGVLVAAHANQALIAPDERAVAYITDGALFVRTIRLK
jgi:hypothetical protein